MARSFIEFGVELYALLFLHFLHDGFEGIDVGFALGLHAEHDVAIHLDETTVAVPCKAGISAFFSEGCDSGVVHAKVEDCVHHTGH